MELYNIIGITGVILILAAFFLLQIGSLHAKSPVYSLLNLIGACGILYSLFHTWNLASVIIEIAWILISLVGLYRYFFSKKNP